MTKAHAMSDSPVPPGRILEQELKARGMTQTELAKRAGRPLQVINEIVRGKKVITPKTALDFEKVLGVPAEFWTSLEAIYQLSLARNSQMQGSDFPPAR